MKDERFEDFLKDRLYSEESTLDTASFWDSLEVQLDEDDQINRKVGYYRLAGIASVLLLGLFAVELSIPTDDSNQSDFAVIENINETNLTPIDSKALQSDLSQSEELNEEFAPSTSVEKVNGVKVIKTTPSAQKFIVENTSIKKTVTGDNYEGISAKAASDMLNVTTLSVVQDKSNRHDHSAKAIATLESLPIVDLTKLEMYDIGLDDIYMNGIQFSPYKSWDVAYVVEGGIAPGYQKISFSNTLDDVQEDRLSLRSYVDASLEFKSIVSTPGIWQLEAGLKYNYTRESFDNHETIYREEYVNDAKAGNSSTPGTKDNLSARETKILVKKDMAIDKKIVIHSLELPVGVGFNIQKSNWNWGAMAGVLGQIRVSAHGHSFIQTDESEDRWRDDVWSDKDMYRFGWYGNAHIGYKLWDDVELWARPYVKQYPNAYQNEELDVDLTLLQTGLKIGATWNFHS